MKHRLLFEIIIAFAIILILLGFSLKNIASLTYSNTPGLATTFLSTLSRDGVYVPTYMINADDAREQRYQPIYELIKNENYLGLFRDCALTMPVEDELHYSLSYYFAPTVIHNGSHFPYVLLYDPSKKLECKKISGEVITNIDDELWLIK